MLVPVFDTLRRKARQAILLNFFEGRNNREIGNALGAGEDAARKRIGWELFVGKRGKRPPLAVLILMKIEQNFEHGKTCGLGGMPDLIQ